MNGKFSLTKERIVISMIFLLFVLLLARNPFSTRNLISNLDPFPDSIYYLNPPISLLRDFSFHVYREGRAINTSVPPLYSFSLLPAFLFTSDPRAFYFINVALALLSFGGLYLIVSKLTSSLSIKSLVLFIYVTNFFIYWYPSIAMSENLVVPLFMSAVLLLIYPATLRKAILAGLIGSAFYFTKYANFPIMAGFLGSYLLKLLLLKKDKKETFKYCLYLVGVFLLSFVALSLFEYFTKGTNPISDLIIILSPSKTGGAAPAVAQSATFSLIFFKNHFSQYLNSLVGKPIKLLWFSQPIIPSIVGMLGVSGLFIGLINKTERVVSLGLLAMLFLSIIFMSVFYDIDARFIYSGIPTLLIGVVIFLEWLRVKSLNHQRYLFKIVLLGVFIFYLHQVLLPVKNQLALNFKHSETPWSYLSVVSMNQYFSSHNLDKTPVLISALPPYFVDFYKTRNLVLLPLSADQEFRKYMIEAWGDHDYSNLISLYKNYLAKGDAVFVDNSALGNEKYLHDAFAEIKDSFDLKEVSEGCFDTCNIYQLYPKQ